MNQSEFVAAIAEVSGASKKDTEAVLKSLASVVQSQLYAGDEVPLPGIGKLKVATRAARTGRNPATGEPLEIPAKKVPHFTAAKALKDAVAG